MKINYASGAVIALCLLPSIIVESLLTPTYSGATWILWGLLNIVAWRLAYHYVVLKPISASVPTGLRYIALLMIQGLFWYLLIIYNQRP